ncbi:MAG: hypothetical protein LBU38_03850, partial [Propionibacteriaceae bacterium]|nr:hypothetical protein [Propionibacteriaceae bacterium]
MANFRNVQDSSNTTANVSIAMASKDSYAITLMVALYSILSNFRKDLAIDIYLLLEENFSQTHQTMLKDIVKRYPKAALHMLFIGDKYDNIPLQIKHIAV